MGMYTEFFVTARVRNIPEVVSVISALVSDSARQFSAWPDHAFFRCDRFRSILRQLSYSFTPLSVSQFEFDRIGQYWCLVSYSSLKNYDDEIEKFIDWLRPYLEYDDEGEMIGYSRYEQNIEPVIYRARPVGE